MGAPFTAQPVVEPGLVGRVMGGNLLAEVNNLFASAARPSDVPEDAVSQIAESYGIDPSRKCAAQLEVMYGSFLEHCLADRKLSDSEVEDLAHLQRLFGLSDAAVERIHEQKAGEIYGKGVADAVADGRLSPEERTFLEKLQSELRLPDQIAQRISTERAQKRLNAAISAAPA